MNDFHILSTQTLEEVTDFFDSSWREAEVDLLEGSLTVTLPQGRQYVINKHGVTHQIWVSSPFTGAHHFHYKNGSWYCTRTNIRLEDLLLNERNIYAS